MTASFTMNNYFVKIICNLKGGLRALSYIFYMVVTVQLWIFFVNPKDAEAKVVHFRLLNGGPGQLLWNPGRDSMVTWLKLANHWEAA